MNRLGYIAYGVSLVAGALLTARYTVVSVETLYRYAGGITALGAGGWLAATVGPLALSLIAWSRSGRTRMRWLPHLLFIPTAIAMFRMGSYLYFDAVGVSGDSMVEDFALLTGYFYLLLTFLLHSIAFVVLGVAAIGHRTSDN